MSTNYANTFVATAPDCPAMRSEPPGKPDTIAGLQYALLRDRPYALTSDDLLFEVHARRAGLGEAERDRERAAFFAKPQACLRASPLVKRHGFGIHHDREGRVAAYGIETDAYQRLASDPALTVVAGMRNRRP